MTSDANAEPPGLLTRRTTAPMLGSRAALLQRRDQRVRPGDAADAEGQLLARPVDDRPVDQHDRDAAARPGARRDTAPISGSRDADVGAAQRARDQHLQLALVGDAVDQPGDLRLRRREQTAIDQGADVGRVSSGGRRGCDRRDARSIMRSNTSSSRRVLLARTSGDCSVITYGSIAPLNAPMRTRSTWTPMRSIAALVEGHVLGEAGQRQLARRVQHDRVGRGRQVVLARRRGRRVGEHALAARAQRTAISVAQLLDARGPEVDVLDLEQHGGDGRVDRQARSGGPARRTRDRRRHPPGGTRTT